MPFKQRTLKVETHDAHNIRLLEPLVYVTASRVMRSMRACGFAAAVFGGLHPEKP